MPEIFHLAVQNLQHVARILHPASADRLKCQWLDRTRKEARRWPGQKDSSWSSKARSRQGNQPRRRPRRHNFQSSIVVFSNTPDCTDSRLYILEIRQKLDSNIRKNPNSSISRFCTYSKFADSCSSLWSLHRCIDVLRCILSSNRIRSA